MQVHMTIYKYASACDNRCTSYFPTARGRHALAVKVQTIDDEKICQQLVLVKHVSS